MAALRRRNGSFRHGGRQSSFTLGRVEPRKAELAAAAVDRVLLRLEQGLMTLPTGAVLVEFVRHDGRSPADPVTNREPPKLAAFRTPTWPPTPAPRRRPRWAPPGRT